MGYTNGQASANGVNGNGNGVSFRWLANTLLALVGAVVMTGLAWLKTSIDTASERADAITDELRPLETVVTELRDRQAEQQAQLTRGEQELDDERRRYDELRRELDIDDEWIQTVQAAQTSERNDSARRTFRR